MPTLADISDRSKWISASAARKTWRLTDEDLEKLPYIVAPNPRGRHLPSMRLFRKEDARNASYMKWGGPEGLRAHNAQVQRANQTRTANRAAGRGGRGLAAPGVQRGGVQRRAQRGAPNPAAGRPHRTSHSAYWDAAGTGRRLGSSSEVHGDPSYELEASWDDPYTYDPAENDYGGY